MAVIQVLLGPEPFIGNAVPTRVGALEDVTTVEEFLKKMLYHLDMAFLGGADEVIVGDVKATPEVLEANHHLVTMLLGCFTPVPGGLFHLLAVFICSGKEHDFAP